MKKKQPPEIQKCFEKQILWEKINDVCRIELRACDNNISQAMTSIFIADFAAQALNRKLRMLDAFTNVEVTDLGCGIAQTGSFFLWKASF